MLQALFFLQTGLLTARGETVDSPEPTEGDVSTVLTESEHLQTAQIDVESAKADVSFEADDNFEADDTAAATSAGVQSRVAVSVPESRQTETFELPDLQFGMATMLLVGATLLLGMAMVFLSLMAPIPGEDFVSPSEIMQNMEFDPMRGELVFRS